MTAPQIIDGKAFAERLRRKLSSHVHQLRVHHNVVPGLAVVLVGEDPASQAYVRAKGKATREAGMTSFEHKVAADTSEETLLGLIASLNQDPSVHGILVQLPLPPQINTEAVIQAIDPEKDVDGFHVHNAGRLFVGQRSLVPCTPKGCIMLLKDQLGDLAGLNAVVLGRSNIVGKPVSQMLLAENCTVTMAHSRSRDLPAICRTADILIVAVGRPQMVRGDWIKPGCVVIDVGINRVLRNGSSSLVGDVDFESVAPIAGAITPVPGGVGPMTIACLLTNTVEACCQQNNVDVAEICVI